MKHDPTPLVSCVYSDFRTEKRQISLTLIFIFSDKKAYNSFMTTVIVLFLSIHQLILSRIQYPYIFVNLLKIGCTKKYLSSPLWTKGLQ